MTIAFIPVPPGGRDRLRQRNPPASAEPIRTDTGRPVPGASVLVVIGQASPGELELLRRFHCMCVVVPARGCCHQDREGYRGLSHDGPFGGIVSTADMAQKGWPIPRLSTANAPAG